MAARRALITGIAGQDGSLLAELLVAEGYDVFGIVRRATSEQFENLEAVRDRIELVQADLLDELSLVDALKECSPHEVYNLASPSCAHVLSSPLPPSSRPPRHRPLE
jgi:GDPmannose 4,6-dehydratase